jgi:23S rRNA (adenine2503-C2)-methyltransferase
MEIKNNLYNGNAGLQLSINSTNELERNEMFSGNAHTLEDISNIMKEAPDPKGRKITLNFAVANYTVDPKILLKYFFPDRYVIKLTPMHKTSSALNNNIQTNGDYTTPEPYEILADNLRNCGYDVLVFIASNDEEPPRRLVLTVTISRHSTSRSWNISSKHGSLGDSVV